MVNKDYAGKKSRIILTKPAKGFGSTQTLTGGGGGGGTTPPQPPASSTVMIEGTLTLWWDITQSIAVAQLMRGSINLWWYNGYYMNSGWLDTGFTYIASAQSFGVRPFVVNMTRAYQPLNTNWLESHANYTIKYRIMHYYDVSTNISMFKLKCKYEWVGYSPPQIHQSGNLVRNHI